MKAIFANPLCYACHENWYFFQILKDNLSLAVVVAAVAAAAAAAAAAVAVVVNFV